MPTQLQSEILYEKTQAMNLKALAKKGSVQYQNVVDKQIISSSKGHHYKPWPGRKSAKVDEVFKPISTITNYADKVEKTEDKASNFAAPDWGRLEKLTYLKKQAANRKVGDLNVKKSVSEGENVNISDTMLTRSSVSSISIENYKSMDMKLKSFLPGDKQIAIQPPQAPVDFQRNEEDKNIMLRNNVKGKQADAKVRSSSPLRRDLSPHRLIRAGINRIRSSNSRESSSSVSSENSKMPTTPYSDYSCDDFTTSTRRARRTPSPKRILNAGLNLLKNSSTRGASSEQSTKGAVCSDSSIEDDASSNTRSRRSPLRRLFDPLKPKNQVHVPGPITSLPSHRVTAASNNDKLPIRDELILVHKSSNNSSRKALLKLTLKNGTPLFMLSSCDSNILAATVRKSINKNECEFMYTIFAALEAKKKGGAWSNVNKSKKHDMASNVAAHMRVGSVNSTKEFILCDAKQNSIISNELAAVVVDDQRGVTVVIPKGTHGIATTGEPSSLFERWKSGGSCDCGGWDEGCMLTILTNNCSEKTGNASPDRIDLCTQGKKKDTKYAFSMTAYMEGVYAVDFGVSISYIQAFAMCISSLHNKFNCSVQEKNLDVQTDIYNECIDQTNYVPDRPPPSPIKRA